jgi:hypothetical protein
MPSVWKQRQPDQPMPYAEASAGLSVRTCYLLDPASSHMLVSKINPLMRKYFGCL